MKKIISYGKRKVGRNGRFSLKVSLPKAWSLKHDIHEGDIVEALTIDGNLILRPLKRNRYEQDEVVTNA